MAQGESGQTGILDRDTNLMSLRMSSASIRRDSSLQQLQKRIPSDIVERAAGRSYPITLPAAGSAFEELVEITIRPVIKLSLRVRDPAAAKVRVTAVCAQLDRIFGSLRNGSVNLNFRQAVALSGEIYRLVVERFEMNPGIPEDWEAWKGFHWAAMEGRIPNPPAISWKEIMNERSAALGFFNVDSGPVLLDVIESLPPGDSDRSLEVRFGLLASWVLARHGLEITPESRCILLQQVAEAALDAGWAMKRASQGDYAPDPKANRFPPIVSLNSAPTLTFRELFDGWRAEANPSVSTLASWRPVLLSLRESAGHESAVRLTAKEVLSWKDALVKSRLSSKTVNDTYLACLRALLSFGVQNQLLTQNVALGIRVKEKQRAGTSRLPYEDQEVAQLLRLSAKQTNPSRRWIPLLAVCTGARAGELAQLWAERVREQDGVFVLDLKPAEDGGTFKNAGSERAVPVHPALVEAGFLDFVCEKRAGPLFYGRSGKGERHASKGTVNHLSNWIRKQPGFDNPRKAPTHAIRHWWKTTASRIGIPDSQADFIQGHSAQSVSGRYRHHSQNLKTLAEVIARIPIPK